MLLLLALLSLLMACTLLVPNALRLRRMRTWLPSTGTILYAAPTKDPQSGATILAHPTVQFTPPTSLDSLPAPLVVSVAHRHPEGKLVPLRYNPADPSRVLLASQSAYPGLLLGVPFFLAACTLLTLFLVLPVA